MKHVILAIAMLVIGVFFVANGFQSVGNNVFGQYCGFYTHCWRPEWVAVGAGFLAVAYYAWKQQKT